MQKSRMIPAGSILLSLLFLALWPAGVVAQEPPVNVDKYGAAVKGFDVVAYFDAGEPVRGLPEIDYEWNGAVWHFSNHKNLSLFRGDPEKYAPRYGGYCAFAVSRGYTADIDPEAWTVVDGKLYLNYNKKYRKRWAKDIPGNIKKADGNWPGVLEEKQR
jgi:YHS domain-containing protein